MAVQRNLRIVTGVILLLLGLSLPMTAILVVFIMPEQFASTARIAPATSDPMEVARAVEIIQSRKILERVATNLDLPRKFGSRFKESDLSLELTIALVRNQMSVRQVRDSLIQVTVVSEDRIEAATIANEIAYVYCSSTASTSGNAKSSAEIIDRAEPGLKPVRPNKVLSISVALGVGLALVIIGIVLLIVTAKQPRVASPPLMAQTP